MSIRTHTKNKSISIDIKKIGNGHYAITADKYDDMHNRYTASASGAFSEVWDNTLADTRFSDDEEIVIHNSTLEHIWEMLDFDEKWDEK